MLVTSNEQMLVDKRVDECVLFRYADCVQNHPILYQVFIERLLYSYEELYGTSEGMKYKIKEVKNQRVLKFPKFELLKISVFYYNDSNK